MNEPGTQAPTITGPEPSVPCPCRAATELAPLMTFAEVCEALRIRPRTGFRLLSAGRLPTADVTFGGERGRRWRRDRLTAWIGAGCPPAAAWTSHLRSGGGASPNNRGARHG